MYKPMPSTKSSLCKLIPSPKSCLYLESHPDDESLVSGTISHFADQGAKQTLFCATKGEHCFDWAPPEVIAERRAVELTDATDILGINQLIACDYGDGELPQKTGLLVERLFKVLIETRPELVITFGPSGITGHDDHKTMYEVTRHAVEKHNVAVRQGRIESALIRMFCRVVPQGATGIVNVEHDEGWLEATHSLDVTSYREQMLQAMQAHKTQQRSMSTIFPALKHNDKNLLWKTEYYVEVKV